MCFVLGVPESNDSQTDMSSLFVLVSSVGGICPE